MENNNAAAKWYQNIVDKVREIVDRYGLPEDIAADVRAMTFEIARDQYKVGNKAGIAWLKREQAKNGVQSRAVAPQVMAYSA